LGLAQAGARVCVNDIHDAKLDEARRNFWNAGMDVAVFRFDVSSEKEVDRGISEIGKAIGNIDILVNNAGIIKRIPY
jgi:gluconate 5-dehydrogenase